jgi:hypothetical protein
MSDHFSPVGSILANYDWSLLDQHTFMSEFQILIVEIKESLNPEILTTFVHMAF